MNVQHFWLWFLASWLLLLHADLWVPFSRDSLLFYPLDFLPRWLECTQHVGPVLLGGFCEGKLKFVCNFHFDANVRSNVYLQLALISVHFIMNICCKEQFLKRLISHPLLLVLLLLLCWVVLALVSQLAYTVLWLFSLWIFVENALLLGFWYWWQVPFELNHPFQSPVWRLSIIFQRDQHVIMLRMHPWMPDHPLLGGRTILWLYFFYETASLIADISFPMSVLPVSWTFSYLLLSLNLACKFAHKFVGLPTGWCWHLGLMPSCRDEVKEKSPFVNEDTFSETKSSLPNFLWTVFGCPFANEDAFSQKQSSLPIFMWTVFGWTSQAAVQMLLHVIPLWCQLKTFPQAYAATLDVKLTLLSVISLGPLFSWNCCIQDWISWAYYVAIVIVLCIKGLVDHLNYPRCFLRRSGKNLLLYFIF